MIRKRRAIMENKKINEKERGQSLIEMAISFTIIMLLISGIVDLGRAYISYIAIFDAAQEGAAYGAYYPRDPDSIELHVRGTSSNPIDLTDTDSVEVEVIPHPSPTNIEDLCAGDGLEVKVIYTFDLTMPFLGAFIPSTQIPLTANAIGTVLSPACN
jgi:hypothetical protein